MYSKPIEWGNYLGHSAENFNDIFTAIDNGYNALFGRLFPDSVSQPLNRGGHRMEPDDVNGLLRIIAQNVLLFQRTSGQFEYNSEYEYPLKALVKYQDKLYLSVAEVPVNQPPLIEDIGVLPDVSKSGNKSEVKTKINSEYWKLFSDDQETISDVKDLLEKTAKRLSDECINRNAILDNKVEKYKNELDNKDILHDRAITNLVNQDAIINARIDQNKSEIDHNSTQIDNIKSYNDTQDGQINDLFNKSINLQSQITDLKNTDASHDALFTSLKAKDNEIDQSIANLNAVDAEYRQKLSALDAVDTSVADTLTKINDRLLNIDTLNSKQSTDIQNHQNLINAINTKNDQQDTKLEDIDKNISTLYTDNDKLVSAISLLNKADNDLADTLDKVQKKVDANDAMDNSQNIKINNLAQSIKNINNNINNSRQTQIFEIEANQSLKVTFNNIDYLKSDLRLFVLDEEADSATYNYWINSEGVASIAMNSEGYLIFNDDDIKHKFLAILN